MPRRWSAIFAAFLLAGAVSAGRAQEPAEGAPSIPPRILPGIGAHDPRVIGNPNAPPWRAVGKLQAAPGGIRISCTGALVRPAIVLTAAHCIFNHRTGNYLPATALHFLIGYDHDTYTGQAQGVSVIIGPGYDPSRSLQTAGSDWALLTIDQPLGTADRILPIAEGPVASGTAVMLGGYSQDHPYILMLDPACRIIGTAIDADGRHLLRHNCTASRGVSGAPILAKVEGGWRIIAIDVAAQMGVASGVAAALDDALKRLNAK